jgi:hypothetical protein
MNRMIVSLHQEECDEMTGSIYAHAKVEHPILPTAGWTVGAVHPDVDIFRISPLFCFSMDCLGLVLGTFNISLSSKDQWQIL